MKSEVRKPRSTKDPPDKTTESALVSTEIEGNSNEYTSESPSRLKSDIENDAEEPVAKEFQPVDPYIFVKASRKYLAQNPPETSHLTDYASGVDSAQLRACKCHADKQSRAFEYFLVVVTSMYYGDPYVASKVKGREESLQPGTKVASKLPKRHKERSRDALLSTLVSPIRHQYNFESWTPKELAVFEAGLCTFGKQFDKISSLLNCTKTISEITALYYDWKHTSHYKYWKEAVIRENWK